MTDPHDKRVDYSDVTPATSTHPGSNKELPETLANQMPTADSPANTIRSKRSDPDKTIPGPEAATGVDEIEEDATRN